MPVDTCATCKVATTDHGHNGRPCCRACVEGKFWAFVEARQTLWYRRHVERVHRDAWTTDPHLATGRYTNVYRALDRGTLYAFDLFRHFSAGTDDANVALWHLIMYRVINRIESYQALIRDSLTAGYEGADFYARAKNYQKRVGPVMTGAYMSMASVTAQKGTRYADTTGVLPKVAALGDAMRKVRLDVRLLGASGPRDLFNGLRDVVVDTGLRIGPFTANQIAMDLISMGHPVVRFDWQTADGWVHVGPGCVAGLKHLGLAVTKKTALGELRELRTRQQIPTYAPLTERGDPVPLALMDVEHALCEWQKYIRQAAGGATKRYREDGAAAWEPEHWAPRWWRYPPRRSKEER